MQHTKLSPTLLALAALLCLAACTQQQPHFTTEVLNAYTPVKNQGRAQTCWAYAMLSTIETEHIMRGDSVHLSVAFVERAMEADTLAPASKRGVAMTLTHLLQRHGVVPFDAMPNASLPLPRWAFMGGVRYTPQQFARSVCAPGEYVALQTTPHQPYGQVVPFDVPDNWQHLHMLNLPPDSLLQLAERAVRHHHGVCWEGDTSERGFDFRRGVAQTSLISGTTTDDHCMAIVGIAHDDQGERYFIMKNSWGTNNAYGGLMYLSFSYFRQKTLAICLVRDALGDGMVW